MSILQFTHRFFSNSCKLVQTANYPITFAKTYYVRTYVVSTYILFDLYNQVQKLALLSTYLHRYIIGICLWKKYPCYIQILRKNLSWSQIIIFPIFFQIKNFQTFWNHTWSHICDYRKESAPMCTYFLRLETPLP